APHDRRRPPARRRGRGGGGDAHAPRQRSRGPLHVVVTGRHVSGPSPTHGGTSMPTTTAPTPSTRPALAARAAAALALVLALPLLATPAGAQGALAKAKAAKTLVVGISGGNAPIAWMSPKDEPLGITLDLCKELIKREGIEKLEVYTMPFSSLIPALTSGRIDFACDTFFPTEKRKQLVDFTDIVFYNSETLIVRKGNPRNIHRLTDLGGKSAGSYEGTVWID